MMMGRKASRGNGKREHECVGRRGQDAAEGG